MKKFRMLCILAAVCLLIIACSKEKPEESLYHIYYVNKDATKVVPLPYEPEGQTVEDQVNEFIAALETDPSEVSLKKPISSKVNMLQYVYQDDYEQVIIYFDDHYKELDPIFEVLSRAAIVRTLTQIEGVSYVTFYVKDKPLMDRQGVPVSNMTADMFIDNTGDEINSYEKAELQLYFANTFGNELIPVITNPPVIYNSNIPMERLVVDTIIKGPSQQSTECKAVVSPNVKVISVSVKDSICYVNLDAEFLKPVEGITEEVTIYAFVNALSELPNINKVQFSVEGATDKVFREKFSLSAFYERNLEIIDTGEDTFE